MITRISSMSNFFRCTRCHKSLIAEKCKSHECNTKVNDSKIIEILHYTIHKDKNGNIFIITKTIDGTLLTLKQLINPKDVFAPYDLPPNFQHPNGTPRDSTEPIFLLFILKVIIITNFLFL
jgi:hypothetical protein